MLKHTIIKVTIKLLYYLGNSLLKMGKKEDAKMAFKECLMIDPLNEYAIS